MKPIAGWVGWGISYKSCMYEGVYYTKGCCFGMKKNKKMRMMYYSASDAGMLGK